MDRKSDTLDEPTPTGVDEPPPRRAGDLTHALYRDLFFAERARRESIRASIGTPTAAAAFAVFNLSVVAGALTPACLATAAGALSASFALGAIALLALAVASIVGVELNFVYHEPPDLQEMTRAERRVREKRPDASETEIGAEMRSLLTGVFSIAYARHLAGNERSARRRTWAVRLVLFALVALVLSLAALPAMPAGCR